MPIYQGSNNIDEIYQGSNVIEEVYQGNNLVFSSERIWIFAIVGDTVYKLDSDLNQEDSWTDTDDDLNAVTVNPDGDVYVCGDYSAEVTKLDLDLSSVQASYSIQENNQDIVAGEVQYAGNWYERVFVEEYGYNWSFDYDLNYIDDYSVGGHSRNYLFAGSSAIGEDEGSAYAGTTGEVQRIRDSSVQDEWGNDGIYAVDVGTTRDHIYVGGSQDTVWRLDIYMDDSQWSYDYGSSVYAIAADSNNNVFFGGDGGDVYKCDENGNFKASWSHGYTIWAISVDSEDKVYAGCGNNTLHKLSNDLSSEEASWSASSTVASIDTFTG